MRLRVKPVSLKEDNMKRLLMLFLVLAVSSCGKAIPGPQGAKGEIGATGVGCSATPVAPGVATPNGGTLLECANGSALVMNGAPGSDEAPGAPGTLVQPIKLCPGNSTYPSVFVEVAFCINNSLWAVYSANGGFMTEILPGQWSSNAIGSSCSFTVKPDCVVEN